MLIILTLALRYFVSVLGVESLEICLHSLAIYGVAKASLFLNFPSEVYIVQIVCQILVHLINDIINEILFCFVVFVRERESSFFDRRPVPAFWFSCGFL